MKIAIIGAGITGLSLGYFLSKKGYQVSLFEKNSFTGGLASGFKLGEWYLDRFYHHIFQNDIAIQNLTDELGLKNIWSWHDCGAPIFYKRKIYPFSSAIDLLNFKPLPLLSRLRMGLVSLYLQYKTDYSNLNDIEAYRWLLKQMGEDCWKVVWEPLMKKKFGKLYKDIAMTWIWARIHKRSRYLGYPRGGFQLIINKLENFILSKGGHIFLNQEIKSVGKLKTFDKIIFTGAQPYLNNLIPFLPNKYQNKVNTLKYLGTISILLLMDRPLLKKVYWLNINDMDIPFVACVQQSSLINSRHYNNLYPVYLTNYVDTSSLQFNEKPQLTINQWVNNLNKINHKFRYKWVKKQFFYRELYTQPVFKVGDYQNILETETPLANIFIVNMAQIYPWDRGINYAVELGKKFSIRL